MLPRPRFGAREQSTQPALRKQEQTRTYVGALPSRPVYGHLSPVPQQDISTTPT